jgi:hypothetical protein
MFAPTGTIKHLIVEAGNVLTGNVEKRFSTTTDVEGEFGSSKLE